MAEPKGWGTWYPTPELRWHTEDGDINLARLQQKWCRIRNHQAPRMYDEEWRDVPHE